MLLASYSQTFGLTELNFRHPSFVLRKNDYRPRGVNQKKLKYFVNGVMIGSKMQIEERIRELKTTASKFYYKRKIYATEHSTGDYTVQSQRM